jgi:hypothetical protein
MSEKELKELVKSYGETLNALNELGISAIEGIEKKGDKVFISIENKTDKMLNTVRNFALLFLAIFGTCIGYLFLELEEKAEKKDVIYKYEGIFIHNEEAMYLKTVIDKAADGKKVSQEDYEKKMVQIRREFLGEMTRGINKSISK